MGRSLKKGPFVNAKLLKAIEEMNAANEKKVIKDMVKTINNIPADGGTHDRSARRKKACSCIYYRRHGRSQTGRICSYENLQRSRR